MIPVLAALILSPPARVCEVPLPRLSPVRSERLEDHYRGGQRFADFLADAQARRELWIDNWGRADVAQDLLQRARAVPGTWRLLAVAIDGCSDSVSTIPFIAKLVEHADGLDMRIIDSTVGQALMEAHRTPDGRAATPTVILIDEDWEEAGCWIERPKALQIWYEDNREKLGRRELVDKKMEWYHEDAGATTQREIIEMIEAASRGDRICG